MLDDEFTHDATYELNDDFLDQVPEDRIMALTSRRAQNATKKMFLPWTRAARVLWTGEADWALPCRAKMGVRLI